MNLLEINPTELDDDELISVLGRIEIYRYKLAGIEKDIHDELDQREGAI